MRTLFSEGLLHRDVSYTSIYALIWTQTAHPCGPADTEDSMHFASKMALRWRRGDVTVPNCWIKSLFLFYFRTESILVAS